MNDAAHKKQLMIKFLNQTNEMILLSHMLGKAELRMACNANVGPPGQMTAGHILAAPESELWDSSLRESLLIKSNKQVIELTRPATS